MSRQHEHIMVVFACVGVCEFLEFSQRQPPELIGFQPQRAERVPLQSLPVERGVVAFGPVAFPAASSLPSATGKDDA